MLEGSIIYPLIYPQCFCCWRKFMIIKLGVCVCDTAATAAAEDARKPSGNCIISGFRLQ